MGIEKFFTKFASIVALGTALAFGVPQKLFSEPESYFLFNGGMDINLGSSIATIPSIPEYVRDVPAHPDDWYALDRNVAPIEDKGAYLGGSLDLEARIGLGIREQEKFRAAAGLRLGFNNFSGAKEERNYTNHPGTDKRGYGAALTYYSVGVTNLNWGIFAKASFFSSFHSVFAEYSLELPLLQELVLSNGWDRYDDFETKDSYSGAISIITHTVKLGIEVGEPDEKDDFLGRFRFFAGAKIPQLINQSSFAESLNLKTYPSFFIGMGISEGISY